MSNEIVNQSMIELRSPMVVYRPVLKAKIAIVSEDLDEMSVFSRFILWMIGQNTPVPLIEEVTLLDRNLIIEELMYLKGVGLLEEQEDTNFLLTPLGEDHYKRLNVLETFNKEEHEILIDCLTGNLIPLSSQLLEEQEVNDKESILKDKIVRELYQNLDPANSRDFLFTHYPLDLSAEEKEALHIEVKVYGRILYQPVLVFSVPEIVHTDVITEPLAKKEEILLEERNKEIISSVSVVYPYLPFTLKLSHKELGNYRPAIETIEKLQQLDPELLGEKALRLLEIREKEKRLLERIPTLYLDQVSGAVIREIPSEGVQYVKDRRVDLFLKPQFSFRDYPYHEWKRIVEQLTGESLEAEDWEIERLIEPVQHMTVWTEASAIFR